MSRPRPAYPRRWTARALVLEGVRRFRKGRIVFGHGTFNARDEAVWLVSHVLKCTSEQIFLASSIPVSSAGADRVLDLFRRRVDERKPAAYLTHEAWLGGVRFHVDERAIVPRSHIAGLLQARLAPWITRSRQVRSVLDLCTGSGCLAVLSARAFPRARVDAADISLSALAVANRNVRALHMDQRIRVVRSDLFENLRAKRYDLIICNPPYVTSAAMERLPPEYRHEPTRALAGGRDGLTLVRQILAQASAHLNPRGLLVMEVGRAQARVERAFRDIPFIWPDLGRGNAVLIVEREALAGHGRGKSRESRSSRTRPRVNSRI